MRTTTLDPLAEKYYSISPYAWCGNNPVIMVDPDGKYIVDNNGKKVTYNEKNGWSSNVTPDIKRLGSAMLETRAGRETLQSMMNTNYPITIRIDKENTPDVLGNTANNWVRKDGETTITKSEITLFEKNIQEQVDNINLVNQPGKKAVDPTWKDNMLIESNPTLEQRLGQVGVHEGTHATDKNAMGVYNSEQKAEETAVNKEIEAIRQTNIKPLPIPAIKLTNN